MSTETSAWPVLAAQPAMSENGENYSRMCLDQFVRAIEQTRHHVNVPYGSLPEQKLDIFMPADASASDLPVFIFFHGGGWTNGYKEWSAVMAQTITSLPAILVCPAYRLIPAVSYPEPLVDCINAVKWTRDHIADFGGSPGKIIVAGHSAGGQIAALLALEHKRLEAQGLESEAIKGCFCVSASFHRRMINARLAPGHVPPGDPEAIQPDSPLALAHQGKTSFLITWGGSEERLFERSREMVDRLKLAQCPVSSHVYEAKGHFDMHLDLGDERNEAVQHMIQWTNGIVGS